MWAMTARPVAEWRAEKIKERPVPDAAVFNDLRHAVGEDLDPRRVFRHSGSISTSLGCQKAPARFLPARRSTATLPPTEESTWASRVVGI